MRGWQWAIVSLVLLVVLGIGGVLLSTQQGWFGFGDRLDMSSVEARVEQALKSRSGNSSVTVACDEESVPMKKGRIDDCTATDSTGERFPVRITQDDDRGHFTWVLLPD